MRSPISQRTLKRINQWKLISLLALLGGGLLIVLSVENLLLASLIAFVVSYTFGPGVNFFERHGMSRAWSTLILFAFGGVLMGLFFWGIAPYLGETLLRLKDDMPRFIEGVSRFIADLEGRVQGIAGPLANIDLTSRVETVLTTSTNQFFEGLPRYLKTFITVMLLGPFLAFFMVKDGRTLMRSMLGLVPNHLFETVLSMLSQINTQIGQFVRARLLESLIVGLVTSAGLLIVSFPYAVLLGITAGVTNLIPYLGPIIGAIPAFLIATVNQYSSLDIALVATVYIVAQLIDAGFIIPLLVAKIVDLHPVTVIVVMIIGAQVLGVLGMIISIPVASTLKVVASTLYRHMIDTRT